MYILIVLKTLMMRPRCSSATTPVWLVTHVHLEIDESNKGALSVKSRLCRILTGWLPY